MENNKDIVVMRKGYTKEFFRSYDDGFKQYVKGNWPEANKIWTKTMTLAPYPDKEPVT
jgi:hypothetical protein